MSLLAFSPLIASSSSLLLHLCRWFDKVSTSQYGLFWSAHERTVRFPPAAKELLNAIFVVRPEARLRVEDALKHPWMQGPVESEASLKAIMREKRLEIIRGKGGDVDDFLASEGGAVTATESVHYDSDVSMASAAPEMLHGSIFAVVPSVRSADGPIADDMPARHPAFLPHRKHVMPREGDFNGLFQSTTIDQEVVPEKLSNASVKEDTGKLMCMYLRNVGTAKQVLSNLAGFAETQLRCKITPKLDSGAKLRAVMGGGGGFDMQLLEVDDEARKTVADVPEDAAFIVVFRRAGADVITATAAFADLLRAFSRFIASAGHAEAEKSEVKAAPQTGTVSPYPAVW